MMSLKDAKKDAKRALNDLAEAYSMQAANLLTNRADFELVRDAVDKADVWQTRANTL